MNNNNKRIVKNTIIQYIKIIISVIGAFFATRIVLQEIGVDDYGIFSVIAGLIALFGILNSSMVVAVQRFIAYEIPFNNASRINTIYRTAIITHVLIAIIVAILSETIGLYFVKEYMVFAPGKLNSAIFVFHCTTISFILNIISIPQQGVLIAYERFQDVAIINICETLLKVGIALLLILIPSYKLSAYSILLVIVSLITRVLYTLAVKRNLRNLSFKFSFNKKCFTELTGFAGWNLFGAIANTGKSQGVNILLNLFFGTIVNAAYGISNQINAHLQYFSSTIFQTANSQIIQSYRTNDIDRMNNLCFKSSKFAFILYFSIALFIFYETETLLKIWLGFVPNYCIPFIYLMIINSCIELFSTPLMFITQATGKIKIYFIVVSSIILLIIPCSYISLKHGAQPYSVITITIVINIILLYIRSLFVKRATTFAIAKYWTNVILPAFAIMIISCFAIIFTNRIDDPWIKFCISAILAPSLVFSLSYRILLNSNERLFFKQYGHKIKKIFNR